MKKTGFLFDERFLLHDTGPYHPETPLRLKAIYKGIKDAGLLPHLTVIAASEADAAWIETVHDRQYIERLKSACCSGQNVFDSADNQICAETYQTARLAVGGIIDTVGRVMAGKLDNAFCAVRPPGHHAESAQAMGFCYFNNVAIAARYLQKEWEVKRVGIIDFDVHHGNGTQHIFENDPDVFYYSIHQHPSFAYPGTGREFEKGCGEGVGYTGNCPVLPGQGDGEYLAAFERLLIPAFERFAPEVILLSTGFDAHADDDLADINLSCQGFSEMMRQIITLADTHAQGRLISILEGGYALKRLPELAADHVRILLNTSLNT